MSPRGPFGLPRLTSLGPLTEKTDMEVAGDYVELDDKGAIPEAAIRRTIIDLDDITKAGRPKINIKGVSIVSYRGMTAYYDTETGEISMSFEPFTLAAEEGGKWIDYLKALTAHEYCHYTLEHSPEYLESIVSRLYSRGTFDFREMDNVIEFYDFPQEQYIEYETIADFISHLSKFPPESDARPVEGYANITGTRYSGLSYQEYRSIKDDIRVRIDDIHDATMHGEMYLPGEVFEIDW